MGADYNCVFLFQQTSDDIMAEFFSPPNNYASDNAPIAKGHDNPVCQPTANEASNDLVIEANAKGDVQSSVGKVAFKENKAQDSFKVKIFMVGLLNLVNIEH